MTPIRLTDCEMDALMAAAHPLPPDRRGPFLEAAAAALAGAGAELGPGLTHRIVAQIQRQFWDAPILPAHGGKYR